ncbi:hypothetical protein ACE1MK_15320 [Tenacibaculum maritimum]|uniref:hypothetical protein n=1 Tax=Tenacibaculum maritimum TaxID=107401 RepID=UPI0012E5FCAD|nr:hypothetical protein [Tenacibaculum maritimum]MCD9581768.1 hypothetical protein [Tenacibaculum maritimum]MCD9635942.1 hypothetical protein [Tenacibaculum maritimum]CAA0149633.1 conserved hypothetical protein [Tenacibaculum maritimum]CAA0223499.1 hypothetical protein USCSP91_40111 [Tenacibaculum maritimum]
MLPITIQFQAYIPKSLGKPLLDYFQRDSRFNFLSNKEEFVRKLRVKDWKGFTWLPEPGGFATNYYFATDNIDFHNHHSAHSTRLGLHAEIKPGKIGNYSLIDRVFNHAEHGRGWGGINSQHSGLSHRVHAYIKRIPFYDDMPRASDKDIYIGVCDEVMRTRRSEEAPLNISISNSKRNSFQSGDNNITTIKVSGSANYPFLKYVAPNIDFELNIELYKNLNGKSININISGKHNNFPAYELIIGHRVAYSYNPANYGYSGPGMINLNTNRNFDVTERIR